jgi:hypothetical protein
MTAVREVTPQSVGRTMRMALPLHPARAVLLLVMTALEARVPLEGLLQDRRNFLENLLSEKTMTEMFLQCQLGRVRLSAIILF